MEFVLVTTTSTPDTSRSGSVMKFGDYRYELIIENWKLQNCLYLNFLQKNITSSILQSMKIVPKLFNNFLK